MADRDGLKVLTDTQWEVLAPLIEASRAPYRTDHHDLRRTIEAIIWRHDNGAKWRQIPAELGPWWMAAQTFGRWSRLGAWERLLEAAQRRGGVEAGMAFLDGTGIRAHGKAAGAAKKGDPQQSATCARRSAGRAAVTGPRRASSPTPLVAPSASPWLPGRRTSCHWRRCS
jgi:transposase